MQEREKKQTNQRKQTKKHLAKTPKTPDMVHILLMVFIS